MVWIWWDEEIPGRLVSEDDEIDGLPDCDVWDPDELVEEPDGLYMELVVEPDGNIRDPDETIVVPDGLVPDGDVSEPDEQVEEPDTLDEGQTRGVLNRTRYLNSE